MQQAQTIFVGIYSLTLIKKLRSMVEILLDINNVLRYSNVEQMEGSMKNSDKMEYDSECIIRFPRLTEARDYHEFASIKAFMQHQLGLEEIEVDEVGYDNGMYIGLIHLKTFEHQKILTDLIKYYVSIEEDFDN